MFVDSDKIRKFGLYMHKDQIIETLKTIKDPEIDLDIWTMGLIYGIEIKNENEVKITMTYTSPFCPWGPQLAEEVKNALLKIGAAKPEIEVTFDPPYQMPEELRNILGV